MRGIELLWADRRRPFHYLARLAPFVVGELLDRARLQRLDGPIVAALPKAPIPRFESAPEVVDLCAWFLPEPDAFRILLRRRAELPSAPQAIPSEGPFARPEPLPRWVPSVPTFREETSPRACPHCHVEATRFRDLGATLVCQACGRSFEA